MFIQLMSRLFAEAWKAAIIRVVGDDEDSIDDGERNEYPPAFDD